MGAFSTDMPKNIAGMSRKEVVRWLKDNSRVYENEKFNSEQIGSLAITVASLCNLDLDNEQFLFLMDDSKRVLNEACAGSGKTTISQLKLAMEKLVHRTPGYKMLALAYNEHAAKDMSSRHSELMGIINAADRGVNFPYDTVIRANTIHAFFRGLVSEYKEALGLEHITVAKQSKIEWAMEFALKSTLKALDATETEIEDWMIARLLDLYQFTAETQMSPEDIVLTERFLATKFTWAIVSDTFRRYEIIKQRESIVEFSDYLVKFYQLLERDEAVLKRVQNMYSVILVDEYQDESTISRMLLQKMMTPETKLICIGDGDQAIYGFRGTDSLNCLKFKDEFSNALVYTMSVNRRCRKEIVSYASHMISNNYYRLDKELGSVKEGGTVNSIEYTGTMGYLNDILERLKKLKKESSYVAFRTNELASLLASYLLENNVPFKIKEELEPFKDKFSFYISNLLYLVHNPTSVNTIRDYLHMVTPYKTSDIHLLVKNNNNQIPFYLYDTSLSNKISGADYALMVLKDISEAAVKGKNLSEYFPKLYQLFCKYFWNWRRDVMNFSKELENYIVRFYLQDKSLTDINKLKAVYRDRMSQYRLFRNATLISTMHGLKGLEFDVGFIGELDENFPQKPRMSEGSEQIDVSKETELLEEEMRLLYVAITRSRDEVTLYWNKSSKSIYKAVNDSFWINDKTSVADTEINLDLDLNLDDSPLGVDLELEVPEEAIPELDSVLENNLTINLIPELTLDLDLDLDLNLDPDPDPDKDTSKVSTIEELVKELPSEMPPEKEVESIVTAESIVFKQGSLDKTEKMLSALKYLQNRRSSFEKI